MTAEPVTKEAGTAQQSFLVNVLWIWTGFAVSFVAGLILPPMVARRLGDEGYGIWSLIFSFVGYTTLVDFGMRSAIVRFAAEYRARNELDNLNRLYSTMLLHFSWLAVVLGIAAAVFSSYSDYFFHTSSAVYQREVPFVVVIVGLSAAVGLPGTVLSGFVEGYQRFDLSSRVTMFSFGLRYAGLIVLLAMGYGLAGMSIWVLFSVCVYVALYVRYVSRLNPAPRFALRYVSRSLLGRAFGYGVHTFNAGLSTRVLEQGSPIIIGYFSAATMVGYYNFPVRLMAYLAEPLSRVGSVVQPRVTELITQHKTLAVAELGTFVNRYCFALFVPFATFLPVYGGDLLRVWMGPEFQNRSAALLVPMMVATGFAVAGQYSSTSILFGLARHQWYAYGQMTEAALLVALTIWVVPRHGILGAAWVSAGLMLIFRGFFTPWLVCHYLDYPVMSYLRSIFLAPVLTAVPVYFLLRGLKIYLPGSNWPQLILAGVVASVAYLSAAYFTSLERHHRKEVWRLAGKFAGKLRKAS